MLLTDRIASFNDQEISNSLLAFAKMEHVDVSLLRVRLSWLVSGIATPT
jgi:hypothetical protein